LFCFWHNSIIIYDVLLRVNSFVEYIFGVGWRYARLAEAPALVSVEAVSGDQLMTFSSFPDGRV
jgi:hypothetical protein